MKEAFDAFHAVGIRATGIAISALSLGLIGFSAIAKAGPTADVATPLRAVSAVVVAFVLAFWSLRVRRGWVADAADNYARRLLAACDSLPVKQP